MKKILRSITAFCLLSALVATAGCTSTGSTAFDVREIPKTYPLHSAAQEGQTEAALELIRTGESVNAQDKDGWTPLHHAAVKGHIETATALISVRANIEANNDHFTDTGGIKLRNLSVSGKT